MALALFFFFAVAAIASVYIPKFAVLFFVGGAPC